MLRGCRMVSAWTKVAVAAALVAVPASLSAQAYSRGLTPAEAVVTLAKPSGPRFKAAKARDGSTMGIVTELALPDGRTFILKYGPGELAGAPVANQ